MKKLVTPSFGQIFLTVWNIKTNTTLFIKPDAWLISCVNMGASASKTGSQSSKRSEKRNVKRLKKRRKTGNTNNSTANSTSKAISAHKSFRKKSSQKAKRPQTKRLSSASLEAPPGGENFYNHDSGSDGKKIVTSEVE